MDFECMHFSVKRFGFIFSFWLLDMALLQVTHVHWASRASSLTHNTPKMCLCFVQESPSCQGSLLWMWELQRKQCGHSQKQPQVLALLLWGWGARHTQIGHAAFPWGNFWNKGYLLLTRGLSGLFSWHLSPALELRPMNNSILGPLLLHLWQVTLLSLQLLPDFWPLSWCPALDTFPAPGSAV